MGKPLKNPTSNSKSKKNSIVAFFSVNKRCDISKKNEFLAHKLEESVQKCKQASVDNDTTIPLSESNTSNVVSALSAELEETKKMLLIEKQKREKSSNDLKHAKSMLIEASKVNLRKDLTIHQLSKSENPADTNFASSDEPILFSEFSANFSPAELKILRSVKGGPSNDSSFVNKLLTFLYKDIDVLNYRSATGKKFNGIKKHPVTPIKKELIRIMLEKRIDAESCAKFSQRIGKLDLHIKNGIRNILKNFRRRSMTTEKNALHIELTSIKSDLVKQKEIDKSLIARLTLENQTFNARIKQIQVGMEQQKTAVNNHKSNDSSGNVYEVE